MNFDPRLGSTRVSYINGVIRKAIDYQMWDRSLAV